MANDHIVYLRQGNVNQPAQPNTNPSAAQGTQQGNGNSPIGTAVNTVVLIQAAKQIRDNTISQIGYVTGDYELQEQAEAIVKAGALAVGLVAAPLPTIVAGTISTGFEVYATGLKQRRNQFKQQQQQVLVGKISVNGGRY